MKHPGPSFDIGTPITNMIRNQEWCSQKEQQQTRIGLLSDRNVFVQWTTDKLMMASTRYSYR
jgi:hypothetical protein